MYKERPIGGYTIGDIQRELYPKPKTIYIGNPSRYDILENVRLALPFINRDIIQKVVFQHLKSIGYKEGRFIYNDDEKNVNDRKGEE